MNQLRKDVEEILDEIAFDDSLDNIELWMTLEKTFQINITADEWQKVGKDLDSLTAFINGKGGHKCEVFPELVLTNS